MGSTADIEPEGVGTDDPRRPPSPRWPLVALGTIALAAGILIGLTGESPFTASTTTSTATSSTVSGSAAMPDLVGRSVEDARLALAAMDIRGTTLRWVADEAVPEGVVSKQDPREGTATDSSTEVTLTVSGGGPVLGWVDLPPLLQGWVRRFAGFDIAEPIRVIDTQAGPAFKTDGILFGTCDAVGLAEDGFADVLFDTACLGDSLIGVSGILPDGTRYRVEGLPPEGDYRIRLAAGSLAVDLPSEGTMSLAPFQLVPVPGPDQDPQLDRAGRRLSAVRDGWRLEVVVFEEAWNLLPVETRDALEDSIRLVTVDELPVLQLDRPVRFGALPVSVVRAETSHGAFSVLHGCPRPNDAPVQCDRYEVVVSAGDWLDAYPVVVTADPAP